MSLKYGQSMPFPFYVCGEGAKLNCQLDQWIFLSWISYKEMCFKTKPSVENAFYFGPV